MGPWAWVGAGGVTINTNATMDFSGPPAPPPNDPYELPVGMMNRSLMNHGTLYFNPGNDLSIASGVTITNMGIMNTGAGILKNGAQAGQPPATFVNSGTLNHNVAVGPNMRFGIPATNTGTINITQGGLVFGGTLNQTGGSTNLLGGLLRTEGIFTLQGGVLTGTGSIQTLELRNSANIIVGQVANPWGSIQIFGTGVANSGNYTQLANGRLTLSINGPPAMNQYNRLQVLGGTATLAGMLILNAVNVNAGDAYTLVTWSTVQGAFMPNPGWTPNYGGTGLTLTKN